MRSNNLPAMDLSIFQSIIISINVVVSLLLMDVITSFFLHHNLMDVFHQHEVLSYNEDFSEELRWLDIDTFNVLSAICDTLIPASNDKLSANEMDSCFRDAFAVDDTVDLSDLPCFSSNIDGKYFCKGAIEGKTHVHAALAIQMYVSADEKALLYLVLKAMGCSLGSWLVTGCIKPFRLLSLKDRLRVIRAWRDSRIYTFRTLFQTFKRLITSLYFSYTERGNMNSSWKYLEYYPRNAVNKDLSVDGSVDGQNDKLLRSKVSQLSHLIILKSINFI